jgi:hypothetical protein
MRQSRAGQVGLTWVNISGVNVFIERQLFEVLHKLYYHLSKTFLRMQFKYI